MNKTLEISEQEIASLRYLLNWANERPKTQLVTVLDDVFDKDRITNKTHLESLWYKLKSGYAAAPKGMRGNIITDEQLDKAWGYANFGTTPKRRVVSEALEKITQGYHNGRTATAIIEEELGLVECREKGRYYVLTDLGLKYLWAHEPPDSEAGDGWISVNERLPDDNEDYEVWVKGNIIPIIAHYLSKKYFSDNYDDENYMEEGWYYSHAYNFHSPEFTLDVTHWRPLPQPPPNP